jgi:RNA polymerase sigma-B factor
MIDETFGCTVSKAGPPEVRINVSIPNDTYDSPQVLARHAASNSPDNVRRRELFREFAVSRDRSIRDELVFSHLGMVRQLASRFSNRSEALDDLVQVGIIGLIKAIDRFDPGRGVEFSSFAVPTIVGEIKRHFRDKSWAMRVPRRLKDLNVAVGRAVEELTVELGRSVTASDLATRLGVAVEEIVEAQETSRAYILQSLDSETDSGGRPSAQTVGDCVGGEDHELALLLDKTCLHEACAHLDGRERVIVYLRFFEGVSQSEIAKRLRCTQMHVSRLQRRALEKMRASTTL